MAVTYSTATKQARLTAVINQVDAGAGAGKLKIRDAGDVLLVTFTLADPCGVVSGTSLEFDTDPAITAAASAAGTAAKAEITDDADTVVISGLTVGTSGTDVIITSTTIANGQTITLQTAVINHAA